MSLAGVAVVGVAGLAVAAGSGILLAFLWVIFCGGCALVMARGAYAWVPQLTLSVGGIAIGLAAAAGSGHVRIWVVPGAGHTQALSTAPRLWRETVLGFFDENLG